MKLASRIILNFVIYTNIVLPLVYILSGFYMDIIKLTVPKFTYVRYIKGTEAEVEFIKERLQVLNNKTGVEVVKDLGLRPIDIAIIEDFEINKYLADVTVNGKAIVLISSCPITISRKNLYNKEKFDSVLVHEYLHCFGYDHVDNVTDIMYKYGNYTDRTSIDKYIIDLSERMK